MNRDDLAGLTAKLMREDALFPTAEVHALLDEAVAVEREAWRKVVDQARRETASDPENRWCRNATILLGAALRARATGESGEHTTNDHIGDRTQ